jgi:hypothetical protein
MLIAERGTPPIIGSADAGEAQHEAETPPEPPAHRFNPPHTDISSL